MFNADLDFFSVNAEIVRGLAECFGGLNIGCGKEWLPAASSPA